MSEVECRNCGTVFNLAAQWYYDNLCPSCKAEQGDEEDTWPACATCGDRVDPDEVEHKQVANPAMPGGRERVAVCPDCNE